MLTFPPHREIHTPWHIRLVSSLFHSVAVVRRRPSPDTPLAAPAVPPLAHSWPHYAESYPTKRSTEAIEGLTTTEEGRRKERGEGYPSVRARRLHATMFDPRNPDTRQTLCPAVGRVDEGTETPPDVHQWRPDEINRRHPSRFPWRCPHRHVKGVGHLAAGGRRTPHAGRGEPREEAATSWQRGQWRRSWERPPC